MTARNAQSDNRDLEGKRAVVTGASSGIGFHTAAALSRRGAKVVIPCRTVRKAQLTAARIRLDVPHALVEPAEIDMASLAAVRQFAETQSGAPLHLLMNNAGIMATPRRTVSKDGFELQFATNVVGHFLLTLLLLPNLASARCARVVYVTSEAHRLGRMEFDNLNGDRSYVHWQAYANSKLAGLLMTAELQRRFGSVVSFFACHPGYSRTRLQFHGPAFVVKLASFLALPFSQSAVRGAESLIYAATSAQAIPGAYYGPTTLFNMRGSVGRASPSSQAQDTAASARLFDWLEASTRSVMPEGSPLG